MNPPWLSYLVGTLFTLLIVGGPVAVSFLYALVAGGGGFSTFVRRKYAEPAWHEHPRVVPAHVRV